MGLGQDTLRFKVRRNPKIDSLDQSHLAQSSATQPKEAQAETKPKIVKQHRLSRSGSMTRLKWKDWEEGDLEQFGPNIAFTLLSFDISPKGRIENMTCHQTNSKNFTKRVLQILNTTLWLPAEDETGKKHPSHFGKTLFYTHDQDPLLFED